VGADRRQALAEPVQPSLRSLLAAAAVAVVAYTALIWPWTGAREAYAAAFHAVAQTAADALGLGEMVRFRPKAWDAELEDHLAERATVGSRKGMYGPEVDTHLFLGHRDSRFVWKMAFRAWTYGFQPLATVLALALATPTGLRRRLAIALRAALWVQLYVALRTALLVLEGLRKRDLRLPVERPDAEPAFAWEAPWPWLLEHVLRIVHESPTCYVVPVLVWALVARRALSGGDGARGGARSAPGAPVEGGA